MQKERLKKEVVASLLQSQESIGKIADIMQVQFQTVLNHLMNESPTICKNGYILLIKDILNIPSEKIITEFYNKKTQPKNEYRTKKARRDLSIILETL